MNMKAEDDGKKEGMITIETTTLISQVHHYVHCLLSIIVIWWFENKYMYCKPGDQFTDRC